MKPKPRLEKQEQAAVIALLDKHGFLVWPTSEGRAVRRPAGLPDLYAFHPHAGLALWVEVKRQGIGVVSPEQGLFKAMHGANGTPFVVIGGEAEVAQWVAFQHLLWPLKQGDQYRAWHHTRLTELAKRKAKAQATKTRKRLGISGRGGQKRKS